jgi:hypothetical protein
MTIYLNSKPATEQQVISLAQKYHSSRTPLALNLAVYLIRTHGEHSVHIMPLGD